MAPCAYEGRERPSAATSFAKWSVAERRALLTDWGFEAICGCEDCHTLEAGISFPASTRRAEPLSTTARIEGGTGGSSPIMPPVGGALGGTQDPVSATPKEGGLSKGEEFRRRRQSERIVKLQKAYILGSPILDYGIR